MNKTLAETLKQLRLERNLSQQQLADSLFVDRSTVASWETGRRTPDISLLPRISACLDVDIAALIGEADETAEKPIVVIVDDEKIILNGTLTLLEEILPDAEIIGFTKPSELIAYAKSHLISLAFLDIEMGKVSGMDLCRKLLKIYPRTNVVFLTAYMEYSLSAWDTGACGYLLKPLRKEKVLQQLSLLRYPVRGLAQS